MTSTQEEKGFGVLTEEAVERSRRRLGVPEPQRNPRTTTR